MATKVYAATALTGGGSGALDAIDGTNLADGDCAVVFVALGQVYFYTLDDDSGAAESSPAIISPDSNAGSKRWILSGLNVGGKKVVLDLDGDTSITADTDDQLDFECAGADQITLVDGKLYPATDDDIDLGDATHEFKDLYVDGVAHIDELQADALGANLNCANYNMTNVDIDSGAIDGVTIGASSAPAITDCDMNGGTIDGVTFGGASNNTYSDLCPAGTKAIFYQDSAPDGWTIQDTLDDKLVFITKGSAAGGEPGGQAHSSGSWTHLHEWVEGEASGSDDSTWNSSGAKIALPTHSKGVGDSWIEVKAGSTSTALTTSYTNGAVDTSGNSWRPAAYNCIIATKD